MRLEARAAPRAALFAPMLAVVLTAICGGALFVALGHTPAAVFEVFFVTPLRDWNGIAELLLKAAPLFLIGTGLAIGFRANIWNIGAEGQLIAGAICASILAIRFQTSTSPLLLPVMALAGVAGGAAWGAITAWLRTQFHANEILVSLMLSYVASLLLNYAVHGPLREAGQNFPQSILFGDAALFPILWDGTRLNASVLVSAALAAAGWVFMLRGFAAFQMRVSGLAPAAARFAGYEPNRSVWIALLLSGGAAGFAGVAEVAGPLGQLQPAVSPGYGFAAIIVAFLGRLRPLGVAAASLLLALIYLGGEAAQVQLQLPAAVAGMFQGLLLFFLLGCEVFGRYRLRWGRRL